MASWYHGSGGVLRLKIELGGLPNFGYLTPINDAYVSGYSQGEYDIYAFGW